MKKLFYFLALAVLSFSLIVACEKENEEPDPNPDIELGDVAHKFDPNAENVSVEWLGKTIFCQEIDGRLVFQGDIIIIPDQDNTKGAGQRGVRLWDEGKVYYYIDDEKFKYRDDVEAAIENISSRTDIQFIELKTPEARDYREKKYINFITLEGESWSYMGMLSTAEIQSVNMNAQDLCIGWSEVGTVIHELGHALGLIHEHSRSDRDNHIMIDTANIDEHYYDDNDKLSEWIKYNVLATIEMGEYSNNLDYGSIMIYPPDAGVSKPILSKEGEVIGYEEVLKKKDGTSYKDDYQNQKLAPYDQLTLLDMYPAFTKMSPDIIISRDNSEFLNDSIFRAAGELIFEGYYPAISEKGFYYGKVNDDLTKVVVPGTSRGSYHFDFEMKNLEPDANYTVKAYAIQDNEEFLSEKEVTFNTPTNPSGTFTDPRDGNIYTWVTIGNQVWMAENLKYLPSVEDDSTYSLTTPYYYVYGYVGTNVAQAKATENYQTYGVLYNWPAAMAGATSSEANPSGVQGVCPSGWHLPSDAEWTELTDYLGDGAGGKLKETGTTHWRSPNRWATNETGFTALPGGMRIHDGTFDNIGDYGRWWSATEWEYDLVRSRYMYYDYGAVIRDNNFKALGFSIRCVRD